MPRNSAAVASGLPGLVEDQHGERDLADPVAELVDRVGAGKLLEAAQAKRRERAAAPCTRLCLSILHGQLVASNQRPVSSPANGARAAVPTWALTRPDPGLPLKHAVSGADRSCVAGQHGGLALSQRPTRLFIGLELLALGVAAALALSTAADANWDLALLATLLAFSILSDVGAVETRAGAKISGSFLALDPRDGLPRRRAGGR